MKQIYFKVLKTIAQPFDRKHEYLVMEVGTSVICCQGKRFKDYVINCNPKLWQKVNEWIERYVIPYVTEDSINYQYNSDKISTRCEYFLGEDIPHELITYILASKGIKGQNMDCEYPTLLYYPLSSKFDEYTSYSTSR